MKTITFDETKWKLVPIEPTKEMEKSAFLNVEINHFPGFNSGTEARNSIYYAMLSAAPEYKPEADEDGWIKWEGGSCPVPYECWVNWRIRDEPVYIEVEAIAGCLDWDNDGTDSDIVAYRIIK